MKTTFSTLLLCLLIASSSFAQLRKGTVLLGGYLHAYSENKDHEKYYYEEERYASVSFSPVAGVFISDRWVIGLQPSIQYRRSFTATADSSYNHYRNDEKSTAYGIGINARYYVPLNEKFTFFTNLSGVGYSFAKGRTKNERYHQPELNYDRKFQENSFNIGLFAGLGITYFLTPRIGLEATLGQIGYGFTKTRVKILGQAAENEPSTTKNFRGNFNISPGSFGLGLMFYLAKQ